MAKVNNDKISVELDLRAQKAQEEIHRLTNATNELRKQNTEYRKERARLAAIEGDHSAEIKRLNEAIHANTLEIEANKRAMETERQKIDISRMSAAQLGKELKNLKRELNNTSKATNPKRYRELEGQIRRTEKALAEAQRSTRGFMASLLSLDKIATSIKGFFMGLGMVIMTQVIEAFKHLTNTIQDFERANSKLASVLGTTLDGVSRLTDQAKYLGRTTTATASEVTGLQTELAKLGFTQDVIEKLTPSVLKFAKAVDTDLSSAAAFAGAAMRMFNKDAGQAEAVMASFAVATTKSALDFSKLEASLSTVGPVANAFGFSLEETTALLGQLSNAGFDASSAATATRNILLNLADANGALAKALGGPVTNLDELVAGLNKLNTEGVDLAKALELTDKRSVAAFSTFLNGSDSILALRDSITDCTGDFQKMAATMADNAAGSFAGFQSAVEGLILKFFDFREALRTLYEWGTNIVNWIGEIVDAFSPLGTMIRWTATAVGALVAGIGTLVGWFTKLFTQMAIGRFAINTLVAAIIAYKTQALLASTATKTFWTNIVHATTYALKYIRVMALLAVHKIKAAIATRTFNAALRMNPIMLIIGVLAMVVAAIMKYNSAIDDATKKTSAWAKATKEAGRNYGEQRSKLEALIRVAENENLSLERRKKAVAELNRIIPDYNAKIDETTGKYTASREAIELYLKSLEKKMRYEAHQDKLKELTSEAEAKRFEADDAEEERVETYRTESSKLSAASRKANARGGKFRNQAMRDADDKAEKARKASEEADAVVDAYKARIAKGIDEGRLEIPEMVQEIAEAATVPADAAANSMVTRLREISAEIKSLRKEAATVSTDAEYNQIKARIAALTEEKKLLEGKARKRTPGTYGADSLDEVTAPAEDAHMVRTFGINKNKESMSNSEYMAKMAHEQIVYCEEMITALEELRSRTDATHTQTLDKITARENALNADILKAEQQLARSIFEGDRESHAERMAATEAFYDNIRRRTQESVNDGIVDKEAANLYLLNIDKEHHEDMLKELREYYDRVSAADGIGMAEKKAMLEKLNGEIKKLTSQTLTETGKLHEAIRSLSMPSSGSAGIEAKYRQEKMALEQLYADAIAAADKNGLDTTTLEQEKLNRMAALNYRYHEQMWQLKEQAGATWGEEFRHELDMLKNMHSQGLLSEKEYQQKKFQLVVAYAKKNYDYYGNLTTSMFGAIQDAEIAMSDAKYDVLIRQAENNGEDTAALEQEKENKKLEIQKKYADVNFAIKISEIVANTAVAIMQAFSQLGPIGGAISAVLLTATGVAQVVAAKAERDKVKRMQPGNTGGGSSTPATAERALSGFSEGGYTGDGERYEVAGVVHRGEYVVPKPIMNNPRVIDAVGTIEAIRRNKRLTSGAESANAPYGYAEGGFTGAPGTAPATMTIDMSEFSLAVKELRSATKNIKAYVVYKDIETAADQLNRARNPFTRNR